jgi:hypothetical protein
MMKETGKGRRSRIELGYYRTPDRLLRLRRGLWIIAIVAASGWLLATGVADRKASSHAWSLLPKRIASKGPVAKPHAIWDSNCEVCHESFVPINSWRWAPLPWSGSKADSTRCKNCHPGPPHHKVARMNDVPACAECHRDHRGRDASLLAVDNSTCTACHQNLPDHRREAAHSVLVAGKARKGENVSQFNEDHHPDLTDSWRARSSGPNRIKFNHARHLAAGLTLLPRGNPFTFGHLAEPDRARYGWNAQQAITTPVKLECASCHQAEPPEQSASALRRASDASAPRPQGAYMFPIVYENHCAACHRLQFEEKRPERFARHGISARETLDDLRQLYLSEAAKGDPELLRQFVPPRPMPGQAPPRTKPVVSHAVDEKVLIAAKLLFGAAPDEATPQKLNLPQGRRGCVECHNLKPGAHPIVNSDSLASLELVPVEMTPVWQQHAWFNHKSHGALKCIECHGAVRTSTKNGGEAPLLPGIDTCVKCHASTRSQTATASGEASTACALCHRYHNGDQPDHGLGAPARRGALEMTIDELLMGTPQVTR